MKKIKSICMIAFCILTLVTLTACSNNSNCIKLSTTLSIDSSQSGTRQMDLEVPSSLINTVEKENQLDQYINSNCPKEMTYSKVNGKESIIYSFYLNFDSYNDYTQKLTAILGFNTGSIIESQNTVFTKGIIVNEAFSSRDILSFLDDIVNNNMVVIDDTDNTVNINGKNYISDKYLCVNDIKESLPIDSIAINTLNNKDNTYDRDITLKIPKSTVDLLGQDMYAYIGGRASNSTSFDWTEYPSGSEISIKYKDIDINQLQNYTNTLFNSNNCGSISYGDSLESTSLLNNEQCFYEVLDLSSFCGLNQNSPEIDYTYSIENNGQDEILSSKKYSYGTWQEDNFTDEMSTTVQDSASALRFSITDGYTYPLKETDITTEYISDNELIRMIDFVYPIEITDVYEHINSIISSKKLPVSVTQISKDDSNICRISIKGTLSDINHSENEIFGKKNMIDFSNEDGKMFSLHNTQTFCDKIDMEDMYGKNLKNIPVNYTIKTNGSSSLSSIEYITDGSNSNTVNIKRTNEQDITFPINTYSGMVEFKIQEVNFWAFSFCIFLFILVLFSIIFIITRIRKNKIKKLPVLKDNILVKGEKNIPTKEDIEDVLSDI